MTQSLQLIHPVHAEVARDGTLLRIEEPLRELNSRAGGQVGGVLAIPPLLAMIELAQRLQMRLSRPVRVAGNAERVELWVEIDPNVDNALVSVTSMRTLGALQSPAADAADKEAANSAVLQFDHRFRLLRATGLAADGLRPDDFGKAAEKLLPALFEQDPNVEKLLAAICAMIQSPPVPLVRKFDSKSFLISGAPRFENDLHFYQCAFQEAPAAPEAPRPRPSAGALFGKQLAPVLRQPLGRIIANAETIGSELQGPIRENYALYAQDIANAARHLSALVDDLGDLEAIERDDFKTAPDRIELGDVARRVAGLLALKAADHRITIATPPPGEPVVALAEFRRVLQIMLNLVTNAIRYSPDGSEVVIDIGQEEASAVIAVTDNGPGIEKQDRERVFNKFERLGRSGDGGSGLGLYIARRLANAMQGSLTVEDAPGHGARFTLRLPGG